MSSTEICAAIHQVLARRPTFTAPRDVPFTDGLYFYYQHGETSSHGPDGRVVRVGNHPRSHGGLVRRLAMHYSGNKNSSVFRRSIGGALIRSKRTDDTCLLHWEKQDAKACELCKPTEQAVPALLRRSFTFRCVRIDDTAERNVMEAILVASLAACSGCSPSTSWLGLSAKSPQVRTSGLWNTHFVGGIECSEGQFERFKFLASTS